MTKVELAQGPPLIPHPLPPIIWDENLTAESPHSWVRTWGGRGARPRAAPRIPRSQRRTVRIPREFPAGAGTGLSPAPGGSLHQPQLAEEGEKVLAHSPKH